MSFRTTYILFGVLALSLGVFLWTVAKTPLETPDKDYLFPSAHAEETKVDFNAVHRVEIDRQRPRQEKLVFERDSRTRAWVLIEPKGFRIHEPHVNELVTQLLTARPQKRVKLDADLQGLGLEPPAAKITLFAASRKLEAALGDVSLNRVAVISSDIRKPQFVHLSELEAASYSLEDFRSRDLLTVEPAQAAYVRVQRKDKPPVVLTLAGKDWKYVKPVFEYAVADFDGPTTGDGPRGPLSVRSLIEAMDRIRAEGKKDDKEKSGFVENNARDPGKYGLASEDTAEMVLELRRKEASRPEVLLIGNKADPRGEKFYARLLSENHIVTVADSAIKPLRQFLDNPDQIRDRTLVRLPASPDVIRLARPGSVVEFIAAGARTRSAGSWRLWLPGAKEGKSVDGEAVNRLITALTQQREISQFLEGADKAKGEEKLKKPAVTVSLWREGVPAEVKADEKPKLKSETPDYELTFGEAWDANGVVVRRRSGDGLKESVLVVIPKAALEVINAHPANYLEKTVASFFPARDGGKSVIKIAMQRFGKKYELGRKEDSWELKIDGQPTQKASTETVNGLLRTLDRPTVVRWHPADLTPEELKKIGLDNPAIKLVFTLPKTTASSEEPTITCLVSKVSEPSNEVYIKRSDQTYAFVASAAGLGDLYRPLQDVSFLKFDVDKVEKIRLIGWYKDGNTTTLTLTRKSASEWQASNGKKVKDNEPRVFLTALSTMQVNQVADISRSPAEQGFSFKDGALDIELTLEGGGKVQLQVGKLLGDKYFARSSQLPGETMMIPQGPFLIKDNKDALTEP